MPRYALIVFQTWGKRFDPARNGQRVDRDTGLGKRRWKGQMAQVKLSSHANFYPDMLFVIVNPEVAQTSKFENMGEDSQKRKPDRFQS